MSGAGLKSGHHQFRLLAGSSVGDGKRRSVGGDHRIRRYPAFDLREYFPFDIQILDNGFDYQLTGRECVQVGGIVDAERLAFAASGVSFPFGYQFIQYLVMDRPSLIQHSGICVE